MIGMDFWWEKFWADRDVDAPAYCDAEMAQEFAAWFADRCAEVADELK